VCLLLLLLLLLQLQCIRHRVQSTTQRNRHRIGNQGYQFRSLSNRMLWFCIASIADRLISLALSCSLWIYSQPPRIFARKLIFSRKSNIQPLYNTLVVVSMKNHSSGYDAAAAASADTNLTLLTHKILMDFCAVGSVLDLVKLRPTRLEEPQIGAILFRCVF
jgi:hypothetical protein